MRVTCVVQRNWKDHETQEAKGSFVLDNEFSVCGCVLPVNRNIFCRDLKTLYPDICFGGFKKWNPYQKRVHDTCVLLPRNRKDHETQIALCTFVLLIIDFSGSLPIINFNVKCVLPVNWKRICFVLKTPKTISNISYLIWDVHVCVYAYMRKELPVMFPSIPLRRSMICVICGHASPQFLFWIPWHDIHLVTGQFIPDNSTPGQFKPGKFTPWAIQPWTNSCLGNSTPGEIYFRENISR